jgi:hypothetical protein
MLLTVVTIFYNRNQFVTTVDKIWEGDQKFYEFGLRKTIYGHNPRVIKILIVLLLVVNTLGTLLIVMVRKNLLFEFIVISYPLLVVTNTNLLFFGLALTLQSRFKMINDFLLKKIKVSKSSQFVNKLFILNRNLRKLSANLNEIFSYHLLLWMTMTSIGLVFDLYLFVYITVFNLLRKHPSPVFQLLKNIFVSAFDLFCFSTRSSKLSNEVSC